MSIPILRGQISVREYLKAIDTVDAARAARRGFKTEKSLNDSILDAYEQVEKTSYVNEMEVRRDFQR